MKLTKNTSLYETKKLKSLFCLIHNQIAKYEGRLTWWDDLNIEIRHKSWSYSGRAYLKKNACEHRGRNWDMFLSMSRDLSLIQVAQLFAHELMHSYGYHHNQFNTDPLVQDQLDEINKKFNKNDLLVPHAMEVKTKTRQPRPCYWKLCDDLLEKHSWLEISEWQDERRFSVEDTREYGEDDSPYGVDDYIYTELDYLADETTTWCKAYKLALKLIKGNLQQELITQWHKEEYGVPNLEPYPVVKDNHENGSAWAVRRRAELNKGGE